MDHDEVLEQLELAATEPDGLARLTAGDTAVAAAVAGHLVACEACSEELRRLSRAEPLLRDVVRTTPTADLRARTLEFVRQHGELHQPGEPREIRHSRAAAKPTAQPGTAQPVPVFRTAMGALPASERVASSRSWPARILPWAATLAAAVVLSVAATSFLVGRMLDERLATQTRSIGALEKVTLATLDITSRDDAQRVKMIAPDDGATTGSLLFSPSTMRLVVVAEGLAQPPAGSEYRCWMEIDGRRSPVGKMFFADDLAFWVGDTPEVSRAVPGTMFGVSLTEIGGPSLETDPVIAGRL